VPLFGAWPCAHADVIPEREKTDVIVLKNGDHYTGRIIYAQYGILELSSRNAGSVAIEWPAIESIQSKYPFRVERVGGTLVEGLISTKNGELLVNTSNGEEVAIPLEDVTQILPYEASFWRRVYGSVSLGYSYAKISGVAQTNFEFIANYADAKLESTLTATVQATQDTSGTSTAQEEITSNVFFNRPNRNFWGFIGDLQRNRALGVDGRVVAGSVIGHRLMESTTTRVLGFMGLVFSQEKPAGGVESTLSSVEGAFGGTWRVFRFTYPKINLAIKLSAYLNYDSKPPDPTATSTDYGVVTSLAYQFGSIVQ
jgi:hypothetical protein